MYALLLQDWLTVRSGSAGVVTQGEAEWLDLSAFLDVIVFMETKNFVISAGNLMMSYQTSPTKDDVLFQSMNDVTNATGTPVASGVQTFVMLRDTALCPLAHWLRWQLGPPPTNPSGASSFEATFRVWVAVNQPGGYAQYARGHGSGDDAGASGGPAWTQGPAVGGSPPSGSKLPPVGARSGSQSTSSGGNQRPNFTQGPPRAQDHDKASTLPGPPVDRKKIYDAPLPRSIVPYVPPGVKISRRE